MMKWFLGMVVVCILGMSGTASALSTTTGTPLPSWWPSWYRQGEQVKPATANLQANLDDVHNQIKLHITYTAEQHIHFQSFWQQGITYKKIAAVQALINGQSIRIEQVQPLSQGSLDMVIDAPAGQNQALNIQIKTYVRYQDAAHSELGAISNTVQIMLNNSIPSHPDQPTLDRFTTGLADNYVKDELLVGLDQNVANPEQIIRGIASQTNATIVGSVPKVKMYQLRYQLTLQQLENERQRIESMEHVAYVAKNYMVHPQAIPNDNEYPRGSWTSASFDRSNWGLRYVKAPEAWDITTGRPSTKIGVIDTGFDINHDDLRGNIADMWGFTGRSSESQFHGNHVAGTICAVGNNGIGITGMDWRCSMTLYEYWGNLATVVQQMVQAAEDNMRVVNMSIATGGGTCNAQYDARVTRQFNAAAGSAIALAKAEHKDVLWVIAAGNSCQDASNVAPAALALEYPDNIITVAATDMEGNLWRYPTSGSNFGASVTVAAPGVEIYSTVNTQCTGPGTRCRSRYDYSTGTSMAAPLVTGLAGLVSSAHPNYSASDIRKCIVDAANNFGHNVPGYGFSTISAPESIRCQKPASGTPDCIFERLVHPDGCESHNPTAQVDYFKSDTCAQRVRLTWDENDPSSVEDINISNLPPGGSRTLGRHTYAIPGDHWINVDSIGSDGKSCLFVPLIYLFRLDSSMQ